MQVGVRGIISRVVPPCTEQQTKYGEHCADASRPDAAYVGRAEYRFCAPVKEQHDAGQEHDGERPKGDEIVEILARLQVYAVSVRVNGEAVFHQDMCHGYDEENEEGHEVAHKSHRAARTDIVVVNIVDDVEYAEDAREEKHGKSENPVPPVEECVKAVAGVAPAADYWACPAAQDVRLFDDEVSPVEERGDGYAEQQRTDDAVDDKKPLERLCPEKVAHLALELVADGLQDECEEDNHPQPVGPAEAGAVKQGERGEERSAEGYERGERQFPLPARGVDYELAFLAVAAS